MMSAADPTEELRELDREINRPGSNLPDGAVSWMNGAHETTEQILETIESMQSNGVDAPTSAQKKALYNVYVAACRWLGRSPVEWTDAKF